MADLYPTFEVPVIDEQAESSDTNEKRSAYFDFEKGDFAVDETGRIREATGSEAWKNWCAKCVLTQRYAYLGYSDNYGVELSEAFEEPNKSAQQSMLEHTISEALLADPYGRTVYVKDFRFDWQADGVEVTFTVVGVENQEEQIIVTL